MDEVWILQTEDGKFEFWDNYLHPQCVFITSQKENPFRKKKEEDRKEND